MSNTMAPEGYFSSFVGKGKVTHAIGKGDKLTLCGKSAEGALDHSNERPDAPVACKSCIKLIAALKPLPQGEEDTMTDTTNNEATQDEATQDMPADEAAEVMVTDGEDAPTANDERPTADELREQITANVERIRSIVETGDETEDKLKVVTELHEEAETLIRELPTGERTELRAMLNAAKNGTPAPADEAEAKGKGKAVAKAEAKPEPVVLSAEEVKAREALIKHGVKRLKEGVKLHLKTADLARDVAETLLSLRTRVENKAGVPDLKADSDEAKALSKRLYAAAGEGLDGTDDEVREAVQRLIKSVQNVMSDVVVKYVRELDSNPDEAAKFTGVLANPSPEQPLSEAVFKFYDIPRKSRLEISREAARLKTARAAVSKGTATDEQRALVAAADEADRKAELAAGKGGSDEDEGTDEGKTASAPKSKRDELFESIGQAEAMLDAALRTVVPDEDEDEDEWVADELDDEAREALKAKVDALVARLAMASARLADEA